MSLSVLKNVVAFANVAAGGQATLAHGLLINGVGAIPDHVEFDNGDFDFVSADATNLMVRNTGTAVASVNALVERWHSIPRALLPGVANLTPRPFVPAAAAAAAAQAGLVRYTPAATGTVNVFVDSVNGNNANDGLTAGTALQTLAGVYEKFPIYAWNDGRIVVNFADDGAGGQAVYVVAPLLMGGGLDFLASYQYRGPQMVLFVPATGPASAVLDAGTPAQRVDQTGAASPTGNRTELLCTAAAPGWTVNDFRNRAFARVVRGGVKVVYETPISGNTADSVFIENSAYAALMQAGDTLEIVIPGARIQGPASMATILTFNGGYGGDGVASGASGQTMYERLAFDFPRGVLPFGAIFDRCLLNGGFLYRGTFGCVNTAAGVLNLKGVQADPAASVLPVPRPDAGGDPINTAVRVQLVCQQLFIGGYGATGGELATAMVFAGNVSINGGAPVAGEGALTVGAQSYAYFVNGAILQGVSAGAGVGIRCRKGGQCRVQGGTSTTVTAGGGDLQLETGAAIAYGTGATQFQEASRMRWHLPC